MIKPAIALACAFLIVPGEGQIIGREPPTSVRELSVGSYRSIQEAIDGNPGRMVYVPMGDYEIARKIQLRTDNSGLYGPGRIIQTNPDVPIIAMHPVQRTRPCDGCNVALPRRQRLDV